MSRNSNGAKDPETAPTLRALRRAARRARELGARTGTPVYVIRDQRIIDLTREDRAQERQSVKPRATRTRIA